MSSTTGKYCITASLRCLFLLRDPTLKKENISDTLLQYFILSNVVVSLSTALPVNEPHSEEPHSPPFL